MPSIEDMLVRIDASTQQMEKKLKSADRSVSRFEKNTNRKLNRVDKSFERLGGAITRHLLPALGAAQLGRAVRTAVADLGHLSDQAEKLGLSTTQLQEFRFAAAEVGVSITAADVAMQRFTRRVGEARQGSGELKAILEQYNIALVDNLGKTRPAIEVLGDLADKIEEAGESGEQLRIAFKAFDTEGVQLVNALRKGRKGLEDFSKKAHDAGAVLDEDLIRKADEFDKAWNRAMLSGQAAFKGFAISVLKESEGLFSQLVKQQTRFVTFYARLGGVEIPGPRFSEVAFDQDPVLGSGIASFQARLSNPDFIKELERQFQQKPARTSRPSKPKELVSLPSPKPDPAQETHIRVEKDRREAILQTVAALKFRSEQIRRNARAQDLHNQLAQAGVDLKSAEGQKIKGLVDDYHNYRQAQESAEKQASALDDAARALGLTFSSAFEDAIVNGAKLSDVLQGLLQDLARIAARELITAPIAGAAKNIFSEIGSSLSGSFDLGSILGFASGGNPPIGRASLVGENGPELIVPRTAQSVIPNHALGGVSVNQVIHIDGRGADEGFIKRWPAMKQELIRETKMAVAAEAARGGSYARAIGKRP